VATAADLLNQADAQQQAGNPAAAVALYRSALAQDPLLLEAWYGLGGACAAQWAYGDAVAALRRALALRPDAAGARGSLAEALFQLGEVDAAVAEFTRAAEQGDAALRAGALATLACIAPGCPGMDNAAILAARRNWAALVGKDICPIGGVPTQAGRKLRIGYVSAFFGAQNWMKPVWGVISRHDRSRFEIHLLSDGGDPSADGGYADHPEDRIWRTAGVSNAALAGRVRQVGLDVLVDLNGYSRQARLALFMHRPARLQVAWFNMYATSGLDAFDVLVGDAAVLPVGEERHYCERIVRVPGSYLAFEVRYAVPDVAPPPVLRNGWVTFGCLGSAHKITEPVLAAWSRILLGAPSARLLVRNLLLDEASNRVALLARFARHGVNPERLMLHGGAAHYEFLRGYDEVDVALDTFPYNGGTTTTEALWQGVPVLCCDGDRWVARTSRSLMLAAGLHEWVCPDVAGYVAAAVGLAHEPATPARLAALRQGMRARLAASAACDTAALFGSLEALYSGGAGHMEADEGNRVRD
jgi:predicted O-linked N-acetylglucosamine transferase (SPINDLY family)